MCFPKESREKNLRLLPFSLGCLEGTASVPVSLEQPERGERVLKLSVSLNRSSSQPVDLEPQQRVVSGHRRSPEVSF